MEEPFIYKGTAPIEWSSKQVAEFVKLLTEFQLVEEFADRTSEYHISIPAEVVNVGKRLLFEKRCHKESEEARAVIQSAHCPKRPD